MAALALAGSLLGSCGNGSGQGSTLNVFAASSLTDAFEEISQAFEDQYPDVKVRLQFAGSSQLATQIIAGAPVDVFASANEIVMAALLEETSSDRLLAPQSFARNELVIAVPAGNPHGISDLRDLPLQTSQEQADSAADIILAVCDPNVPCGSLATEAASQAGVSLRPSTYEANVRAVLAKLILGEVDVGLIYKSDIASTQRADDNGGRSAGGQRLEYIQISPTPLANYPVAAAGDNPTADAFVEFLLSFQGQQILSSYGFRPIG